MISLQRNGAKLEVDFEKWLMSFDISLSFQHSKKSLYEAVEVVITKFLYQTSPKAAGMCTFYDIVLERDVRNQAGISDFLNFGIKCREIQYPSPEGNNAVRIMTIHKSKDWNFLVIMPLQRRIIVA
jgi:hypothetical protein